MKFRTTILQTGKTTTGIPVPEDVMEALGAGKRPPVTVTLGTYSYRTTVGVMDGRVMIPVSAEHRAGSGVAGGDDVEVELALDTEPRELTLPEDFAAALRAEPAAGRFFAGLSYSNRRWHVLSIEGARTAETRQRRITKSIDMLREGRAR